MAKKAPAKKAAVKVKVKDMDSRKNPKGGFKFKPMQ